MIRHLARRVVWAVAIVWAVVTLTFLINNVIPSDPARMVAGAQARPRDVERIRTQLGLDQPLPAQYSHFMRRLIHAGPTHFEATDPVHGSCAALGPIHLDFGKSYQQHRPVVTILAERLPRTLFLAVTALFIQVVVGVSFGMFAASRRGKFSDHASVGLTLLGISTPTFILGLILQYFLAHRLRLLPLDGYGATFGEHLSSVVLPALTLGIAGAAYYTRLVRDEMIGLLKQDYVRTARAKGIGPLALWIRHGLRNALVPLLTVIGLDLGALVGGAIVTETLFRWPGIGALSVSSLLDRDGPVILATVVVTSIAIVLSNVFVDVSYVLLDPRVRKS